MPEMKIFTWLGAYVTIPCDTRIKDLDDIDFAEMFAENSLTFNGMSHVPEESYEDVVPVEVDEDAFWLGDLGLDDDTERAFSNVIQCIENIGSYVSYARCDESIKSEIADMGERFLRAMEAKMKQAASGR